MHDSRVEMSSRDCACTPDGGTCDGDANTSHCPSLSHTLATHTNIHFAHGTTSSTVMVGRLIYKTPRCTFCMSEKSRSHPSNTQEQHVHVYQHTVTCYEQQEDSMIPLHLNQRSEGLVPWSGATNRACTQLCALAVDGSIRCKDAMQLFLVMVPGKYRVSGRY